MDDALLVRNDEGLGLIGLFHAVDRGNVRMIQRRECAGFAIESRQPFRILSDRLGQ